MLAAPPGGQVRVSGYLSRHLAVWVVPPLPRARPAVPPWWLSCSRTWTRGAVSH